MKCVVCGKPITQHNFGACNKCWEECDTQKEWEAISRKIDKLLWGKTKEVKDEKT